MDNYFKIIAGVFVCLVLCVALGKQNKDMAFVLTFITCTMILTAALTYIRPIIDYFEELRILGKLDAEILSVILKSLGIGILGEITSSVCSDSGNGALGKAVVMLTSGLMIWLTIPMFKNLLEMIEDMLMRI